MSDESDAGPPHGRKRKTLRFVDSSSDSSTSESDSPIGIYSRRRTKTNTNPIQESSDSESGSSIIPLRKKKKLRRVTSDSESNSSGSDIILRTKRTARIRSESESGDTSSSQWESDFSEAENNVSKKQKIETDNLNVDSDSSDGQSEKCPICLLSFRSQEIGTPENCNHMFCLECIQEWSKTVNTCPVDRQEYNLIYARKHVDGKVLRQIPIEKPHPLNDVNIEEDPTFCEICRSADNEDRMLLCDGCDSGYHLYCLSPPLLHVPPGSWFCRSCSIRDRLLDRDFTLYEVPTQTRDSVERPEAVRRRNLSSRLVPRTRQSERVRRQIESNRLNHSRTDAPSTSSGFEDSMIMTERVTSTTSKKSRRKTSGRKYRRRKKYRLIYEIDEATGETIIKKKKRKAYRRKKKSRKQPTENLNTVKKRLAAQLGICAPKSIPQNLPDVRVQTQNNSIGLRRQQAGIPSLHIFGQSNELEYFSDEDIDGFDVLIRRAPNHSDVIAMRRAARRKRIVVSNAVSSTTDLLDSILNSQEQLLSRNNVYSVDGNGTFKIEKKALIINNNYMDLNTQNNNIGRQRPGSHNDTTTNSNFTPETNSTNEYQNSGQVEQHSDPSSMIESSTSANVTSGDNEQDMPQDYSRRTLSATYDPPTPEKNKKSQSETNTGSNTPNSESEVDIYSDIETVSTSKLYDPETEFKPPSPNPLQIEPNTSGGPTDDENDSETEMVIDTEKTEPENNEDSLKEETAVTSTVDSNTEAMPSRSFAYSHSESEIQSEAVQSSNQIDDGKNENFEDKDPYDDDLDSEDGCPNFSIYSKESINLAKHTDISLNPEDENKESEQIGEVSSSPNSFGKSQSNETRNEQVDLPQMDEIQLEDTNHSDNSEEEINIPLNNSKTLKKTNSGLYSDSEDETIVRKDQNSFAISDIRNMTEDISEEERSYTPCLDERGPSFREGLEGLDTEMISDEDRNDFDESHEHKTVSDGGDALEINAKESELDFTRPEDYEEGEIVDKSKNKKSDEEKEQTNTQVEQSKKTKTKEQTNADKEGNKENESHNKESSFKKLSKNTKDRNYRDKERSKSHERKSDKNKDKERERERERRDKKKEKRKEIERYDVRALIAEKPKRDQFGRDIPLSVSRSRSRSFTPPPRRSLSRHRRTPSPKRTVRGRSRVRNRVSRSRTPPRKRSRSKTKKRKRSTSRFRKSRKSRDRSKNKKKARSHSRRRSRSKSPRRKRSWRRRRSQDWSLSPSRSPTPEIRHASPSWTPPRLMEHSQASKQHNLKVILSNDANKKKKEKKRKGEKRKENGDKQRKRRVERTPPPSKEVFASGDNILVSVSFNKENETRDVTTRDKRRKENEEPPKKKKKPRNRNKKDLSSIKPVAIIDLERSPFKEITPSPKDVIVLSDSDNAEGEDIRSVQKVICDSSQQVASPERCVNSYLTGPKTPPEPQIKFSLNPKQPTIRAITNPLHEADDIENEVDQEGSISDTLHKGPNTPPEPPNSPPSSPDAYDPFEPTKSRSASPEPMQVVQSKGLDGESLDNNVGESRNAGDTNEKISSLTPDALKSLTPPVADIQPADSQSSIHATPDTKSPERIGVVINQVLQPLSSASAKPVSQSIPFSSVPTSLITSAPTTNLAPPRINIINSTILAQSSAPRVGLPNILKSSPVKTAKSGQNKVSKNANKGSRKSRQNGTDDSINIEFDSPYSPGSSDYEDLFEPPAESAPKTNKSNKNNKSKLKSTFDALFGSPSYNKKSKNEKVKKVQVSPTKGKQQVGVKLDEDNLKILDELPNSAVEMQVKDKYLKKLNRQERVVEEVKLVLKPHYNKKKITKEEYKDILRRSVPKICHNKSGEINPTKIKNLIEAYVKKLRHNKKVTSSSSVNPQKV